MMHTSLDNIVNETQQVLQRAELVYDAETINAAIETLARQLTERLQGKSPVVLCVMQGGLMFTARIMSYLPLDAEFDYIHASRYGEGTRGSEINWLAYPKLKLANRSVLILDDILDEGHTLAAIEQYCREQGASDVTSAVLLQKKHDRLMPEMHCDFVALEVEDRYVFGYGMDYKGRLRHLDCIYALPAGET